MIFAPNTREAYITRRSRISLPQAISLAVGEYHCEAISLAVGEYHCEAISPAVGEYHCEAISLAVGEYHCEAISLAAGGYLVICFAALSVIFLLHKSDIAAAPQ